MRFSRVSTSEMTVPSAEVFVAFAFVSTFAIPASDSLDGTDCETRRASLAR
jgi:hypothetical protein